LDEYKEEGNFRRILAQIDLADVKNAIDRSKWIMNRNHENQLKLVKYKGFEYFEDNPSLAVWESIERILIDCKLKS